MPFSVYVDWLNLYSVDMPWKFGCLHIASFGHKKSKNFGVRTCHVELGHLVYIVIQFHFFSIIHAKRDPRSFAIHKFSYIFLVSEVILLVILLMLLFLQEGLHIMVL